MSVKVGLKEIEQWHSHLEIQVQNYEKEVREKGQIVFYGPSNFTRWDGREGGSCLNTDILGASGKPCAINRGFGSSCSEHQLYYYHRMVRPLEPKVLVYAGMGGNALAFGYTIDEMWELAERVIVYAMTDFPGIHIYLPGLHPRKHPTPETYAIRDMEDAKIREFADKHENCHYVDVFGYAPFNDPANKEIMFAKDGKHFNHFGYELYADMWREVLKDELALF